MQVALRRDTAAAPARKFAEVQIAVQAVVNTPAGGSARHRAAGARLPVERAGVNPAPRKRRAGSESMTENGVPDWMMVMPLMAQSASRLRVANPAVRLKNGRS